MNQVQCMMACFCCCVLLNDYFFNLVDCSSLAAWLHTSMGVWLVWFVPARVGNAAALNIVVRNPLPLFLWVGV